MIDPDPVLVQRVADAISNAWPSSGYESLLDAQAKATIREIFGDDYGIQPDDY
jgi:hypothetical protein